MNTGPQAAPQAGNMADLASSPKKLISLFGIRCPHDIEEAGFCHS
jgi:high-affinity K+ transport system ATPase subunit B